MLAFDDETAQVQVVMAEAPHGTAPALEGKNIANPMAMILAGAALTVLLRPLRRPTGPRAPSMNRSSKRSLRVARPPTWAATLSTTEFTDEVIQRVSIKAGGVARDAELTDKINFLGRSISHENTGSEFKDLPSSAGLFYRFSLS